MNFVGEMKRNDYKTSLKSGGFKQAVHSNRDGQIARLLDSQTFYEWGMSPLSNIVNSIKKCKLIVFKTYLTISKYIKTLYNIIWL